MRDKDSRSSLPRKHMSQLWHAVLDDKFRLSFFFFQGDVMVDKTYTYVTELIVIT